MVVPLGVGIGDVIGVAKLAKSVMTEIKKKNEALTEYRALLLELDLLAQILDQIDGQARKLKDSDNNSTDQLELIRACCEACREPLQKFLDKISKFEPSLGVWATDGKAMKGAGRKIQWKVAYEDDVRELRVILIGYTVKILLCQNLQLGDSFRACKKDGAEGFHHLQRLVKEHHTLLDSLSNSQKAIRGDSESHQRTLLDHVDQCKRHIIGLADADDTLLGDLGTKIDKFLKSGAESQRKIDGQLDILRGIQAQATSQSIHPSSEEVPAESQTKSSAKPTNTLTTSLAILTVILASSNAALSYKLAKQNGVDLQRQVQHVAKAHNVTAKSQELKGCYPGATPGMPFSHMTQSTKPGVDHPSLKEHPLVSWGKDGGWEVLWHKSMDFEGTIGGLGGLGSLKSGSKYENLSFFFRIDSLAPNYDAQPARHGQYGFWAPPNIKTGYTRINGDLFRWVGGTITYVARGDAIKNRSLSTYSAMTVFTQNPDTPHLLCVPFDAERTHVGNDPRGWTPLPFFNIRMDNSQRTYSALSLNRDRQANPGSPRWIHQLLPPIYNKQSESPRLQAGLIGSLPLLLALAAFSAPPTALIGVLTNCLRPRSWRPHHYPYPAGHVADRGMVVTIFFDSTNPEGSNPMSLDKLQNGNFGPFYS